MVAVTIGINGLAIAHKLGASLRPGIFIIFVFIVLVILIVSTLFVVFVVLFVILIHGDILAITEGRGTRCSPQSTSMGTRGDGTSGIKGD
jgi:hypothetical protein